MEKWQKINAVQRMQDYIKEHLIEKITLQQLAQAAQYSPWHASRIFKSLMGQNPFDYIRRLRLSQAALELRDTDTKVIDVAFDYVFDSHEGFTRAFFKEFGLNPNEYAKDTPPVKLFMPHNIREYYLMVQKGEYHMSNEKQTQTVFVQVVKRPKRKLILKRGIKAENYFEYCEEVGCDVWGVLSSIKDAIHEPMGLWLPDSLKSSGTSTYVQGVEVPINYEGLVPEGYDLINLEPCDLLIFQGEPYDDENFQSAISHLWSVMKTYQPEVYGYRWADHKAPRFQLEPQGYRGYIEGRPVEKITD